MEKEILLEEYYELLTQLEGLHRECALLGYHPHAKQDLFHCSDAYVRYFKGGNRSGKSKASFNEMGAIARGFRPWYPETHEHYRTNFRLPVSINIGSTPKNLLKNVEKYIYEAFQPGEIKPVKRSQQGFFNKWLHANGSTIDVYSYAQDTQAFESDSAHLWLFDEPPPRQKWVAAKRALADKEGRIIVAATPLVEPWLEDDVVLPFEEGDPDFFVIQVSMYDNLGFGLTQRGINQFIKGITEDEIAARVYGNALHLQGLVLSEFRKKIHIANLSEFPDSYFPNGEWNTKWGCAHALDTHLQKNQAVLWAGADPSGLIHIFNELWTEASTPAELAKQIAEKENGLYVYRRLIDPIAYAPSSTDRSTSVADELAKYNLAYEKGSKEKHNGIFLMKSAFKLNDSKRPKVVVWPRCKRFIWETTHWVWKDWEKGETRQQAIDKDDDMMENGRRLLQSGINFVHRQMWEDEYNWTGF